MLPDPLSVDLAADPILNAVESYRGSIVDLERAVVVRAADWARGRLALARQMSQLGLEVGDRIVMAVANGPLFPAALAAILCEGGSPLLVHAETPPAELKRLALRYGARFVVSDGRKEEEMRGAFAAADPLGGDDWAASLWSTVDTDDPAFCGDVESLPAVPLHPTSGTTGLPKVAARPGACAVAEGRHYVETIGIESSDVVLAVAPMSHAYGYGLSMMAPLLAGASIVCLRRFNVKLVHQAVEEHEVTILPAVPAMLDMLVFGAGDRLRRFVRQVFTAGSPLAERTARNFHKASGLHVRPLYGTTETGVIAITTSADEGRFGGCVGRPVPEVCVQVRTDDEHTDLPRGAGSIHVRSTSMMAGYLEQAGGGGSGLVDGWFKTGDLGVIDRHGAVSLKGRETEVINVSGLKVVPSEVEDVVAALPGVVEVKVYPGHGSTGSQFVKAAVVVEAGLDAAEIRAHCEANLVYYKRPERIAIIDALPRSPAGKILRDQLP